MNTEKPNVFLVPTLFAICGVFLGGTIVGIVMNGSQSRATLMAPAPDNKAEQAYRRSGFSDRLMTPDRRNALSTCYREFLKRKGINDNEPGATPAASPSPTPADGSKNGIEGKVTFVFHVDEDGTMLSHEHVQSDLDDPSLVRCVERALKGTRFMPPPLGINRYIAFDFAFKTDETFRQEVEEKKNQSPLMLVTSTPTPAPTANQQPQPQPQPPR